MNEEEEFLKESNGIEGEYSDKALEDAKDAWAWANKEKNINLQLIQGIHVI